MSGYHLSRLTPTWNARHTGEQLWRSILWWMYWGPIHPSQQQWELWKSWHSKKPPVDVMVLDPMLALKHKLDEFLHLVERKVQLCVNSSQQIEGLDYDESYAPTILAASICILVVVACEYTYVGVQLYHIDIKNAFKECQPNLLKASGCGCISFQNTWCGSKIVIQRITKQTGNCMRPHQQTNLPVKWWLMYKGGWMPVAFLAWQLPRC